MSLETTLEIAVAVALPLWLLVEHFLNVRATSQPSGGPIDTARHTDATTQSFPLNNSTGPALRRRAA
jgi:hypothetical protein